MVDLYDYEFDVLGYLQRNIDVFKDTRDFSQHFLMKETDVLKQNTEVIVDGSIYLKDCVQRNQVVEVIQSGTVNCILSGVDNKVAALNFADAYAPGGLVLQGEVTQEECLCRCSNLYESLILDKCGKDYYLYNYNLSNDIFSDRIIYSSGVTFFKDENYKLVDFKQCDIITCPAPLGNVATEEVLVQRIKCILGSAYHSGVDILILGAWGCGAFGCDIHLVASCFKKVIDEYKLFEKVIFAIKCTDGILDNNYHVAKEILGGL